MFSNVLVIFVCISIKNHTKIGVTVCKLLYIRHLFRGNQIDIIILVYLFWVNDPNTFTRYYNKWLLWIFVLQISRIQKQDMKVYFWNFGGCLHVWMNKFRARFIPIPIGKYMIKNTMNQTKSNFINHPICYIFVVL